MTIQFAQEMIVCPITPLGASERRGLFYTKTDYIAFKKQCIMDVVMHEQEQEVCLDGIENLVFKERGERRRNRIANARLDVLSEQADQKLQGVSSPDFIAELYEDISAPCHREAHEKALRFHQEVMSCLQQSEVEDSNERTKRRKMGTKLFPNFVQVYRTTIRGHHSQ